MSKRTPIIELHDTPEEIANKLGLTVEGIRKMDVESIKQAILDSVPATLHQAIEQAEQRITNARNAVQLAQEAEAQATAALMDAPGIDQAGLNDLAAKQRAAIEQRQQMEQLLQRAEQEREQARQQREEALRTIWQAYKLIAGRSNQQAWAEAQQMHEQADLHGTTHGRQAELIGAMRFA
jgi:DNA repair exonuclease SbcCD ATPase subunit